jgi:hypothetical protein
MKVDAQSSMDNGQQIVANRGGWDAERDFVAGDGLENFS